MLSAVLALGWFVLAVVWLTCRYWLDMNSRVIIPLTASSASLDDSLDDGDEEEEEDDDGNTTGAVGLDWAGDVSCTCGMLASSKRVE